MEILGSENILSDVEILNLVCICLENLGIKRIYMRPRVNDVTIFRMLI